MTSRRRQNRGDGQKETVPKETSERKSETAEKMAPLNEEKPIKGTSGKAKSGGNEDAAQEGEIQPGFEQARRIKKEKREKRKSGEGRKGFEEK